MKAQLVKNAVIVPTGAKGGFYPKQLPSPAVDRDAWLAEGTESYRIFIRSLLSVTDNIVDDKVVHPGQGRHPRRRRSLFRGRRRQGHRDLLRRRQRDRAGTQFLARRRLRQRRLERLRPQGDGHHRQGRVDFGPAPLPGNGHRRPDAIRSRSPAAATCRATCSATACCCRRRSSWSRRSTTATSSSIPIPIRRTSWDERKRMFDLPRSSWDDYDRKTMSKGGDDRPAHAEVDQADARKRAPRSASTPATIDPDGADQRDPQEPGRPDLVRRHRHLHQGVDPDPCRGRRSGQRRASGRCQRTPRQGHRRRRQPRHHPGRRGSNSPTHGGRINTDFIDNSAGRRLLGQ